MDRAIVTALLEDFGVVTNDVSNVIDQFKLQSEKAASRIKSLCVQRNYIIPKIPILNFNGQKCQTLKLAKLGIGKS